MTFFVIKELLDKKQFHEKNVSETSTQFLCLEKVN